MRPLLKVMDYFGGDRLRLVGEQRLAAKRRKDVVALLEVSLQAARSADWATQPYHLSGRAEKSIRTSAQAAVKLARSCGDCASSSRLWPNTNE